MILVPFTVAKDNLNNTDPADDALIQIKLEQASDAIFRYCDDVATAAVPPWDELNAPLVVQAATLHLLTALWINRGDADGDAIEKAWIAIRQLLVQIKESALA